MLSASNSGSKHNKRVVSPKNWPTLAIV